jgi:hypothetical protein
MPAMAAHAASEGWARLRETPIQYECLIDV